MVRVLFWPLGSESRIEWRQIGCGVFRVSAAAGGGSGGGYSGGFGDGSSGKGDGSSGGDGEKKWSLISWYLALLKKHPVLTKSVTSAYLNLVGDLVCQLLVDQVPSLDVKRGTSFHISGTGVGWSYPSLLTQ
ncbi:uncharacterized protein LOC108225624 [Daucus carota subsp. sativus]|uniref:uncharacterized protein LOC108225624 n=1 Tax=Daucus carota subsp. sativus TaxID=79200 RepID=UPI0007EEFB40|nr:PREDICTED: uncharacterized protein LOC108225624 [Daucus carota subsp. sativus]